MVCFVKKLDDGYYMISKERISEEYIICNEYEFEVAKVTRGCWHPENNKLIFSKDAKTSYMITQSRLYKQAVVDAIHERYSIDDEIQLLNEKDTHNGNYAEYRTFVNDCKNRIRNEFKLDSDYFDSEISTNE